MRERSLVVSTSHRHRAESRKAKAKLTILMSKQILIVLKEKMMIWLIQATEAYLNECHFK